MSVHKYIGETSRSAFARGLEHQNDARLMNKGSHILKHYIRFHDGENPEEMKMRMKIKSSSALPDDIFQMVSVVKSTKMVGKKQVKRLGDAQRKQRARRLMS